MKKFPATTAGFILIPAFLFVFSLPAQQKTNDVANVMNALLGRTPIQDDLRELCDQIGGRATGSEANLKAVEWGLKKFETSGVKAAKESFAMPGLWLEKSSKAVITGDLNFSPKGVAMPFAVAGSFEGDLINAGTGSEEDFKKLGDKAKSRVLFVETEELKDIDGLFREYVNAAATEVRAGLAGAKGVIYMGSRPNKLLYRHNASMGLKNTLPMMIMAREDAMRCMRSLQNGGQLKVKMDIELQPNNPYTSYNVVGEIKGAVNPDEFVLIGAHLDSWDLGTGANDNGCNAAMMIDIARQMQKLGIKPRRTIRFVLWNGEEQGLNGSWGYTQAHEKELDKCVMTMSIDIGSGRITGFFTGGRPEILNATDKALEPIGGLGPFTNLDVPVVGTDNFDFMMQGVANLIGNHEPANYGPTYHAESDTYDKVNFQNLKINSAIVAAVTLQFANLEKFSWKRQSKAEIDQLVKSTDLEQQMRSFGIWDDWSGGIRGRQK